MAAFYTLLYIADPEDAEEIGLDVDEDAHERWKSLWLRRIGDLELVELWTIVAGDTADNYGTLMLDILCGDGPFVTKVPDAFVTSIAQIPESSISEVVAAWSQIDELKHWAQSDLVNVLTELQSFLKEAIASGRSVLQVGEE